MVRLEIIRRPEATVMSSRIKVTTKARFTLFLPKKNLCVSISPHVTFVYVFYAGQKEDGWAVQESLEWILKELEDES